MCKHYKPGDCLQYKEGVVRQCGDCDDFEPIDVTEAESGYDAANAITGSLSSSFISTVQEESTAEDNNDVEDDAVNHPSHYCQGGIECIDCIKAALTGLDGIEAFCTGNAIKYLFRWKHKNGVQDVRKAIWYCERLLKELETDA